MSLTTLLTLVGMGCALVIVFRRRERKGTQILGVLALALGSLALGGERGWIPAPPSWHPAVTIPSVSVLVGLVLFVRLVEKSVALVLTFSALLQVLVATRVVDGLRG